MDNILVVDDEDGILSFLRKALTYLGYEVKVAHNGEEGIELFKNGCHFDLIITGISMPRMNGNEVAKYIRSSNRSHTPVVAMTGSGDDAIEKELFDFSLIKPFKLKSLIDVVRSFS